MNQEIKKRWIEALLSGQYNQGRGALRRPDDTYCCLGVLCDLYSKEKNIPWELKPCLVDDRVKFYYIEGSNSYLTNNVCDWAQIEEVHEWSGTFFDENGEYSGCLSERNDKGDSFEQIAELIEKYF